MHKLQEYNSCKKRLKKDKNISDRNKELIKRYDLGIELKRNLRLPTRVMYYQLLMAVARDI